MAIEAISGAGMTYQGSAATTEIRKEVQPKVEVSEQLQVSEKIAQNTSSITTKEAGRDRGDDSKNSAAQEKASQKKEQLKKAVDELNRKANNSEAIFGIHEETNRVTIKLVDKDTKEVIKELPPEKTLDMIAKVWEMAGILVDEKR